MRNYTVTLSKGETKIETVVEAVSLQRAAASQNYTAKKLGMEIISVVKNEKV